MSRGFLKVGAGLFACVLIVLVWIESTSVDDRRTRLLRTTTDQVAKLEGQIRRTEQHNAALQDRLEQVVAELQANNAALRTVRADLGSTKWRMQDVTSKAQSKQREQAFTNTWNESHWCAGVHCESKSGPGSFLRSTAEVREFIGAMIRMYNISSVLDAPCGDFNWQPFIPELWEVKYTGMDIVRPMVEQLAEQYAHNHTLRASFVHGDLISDRLEKAYDLVMVRDALFHMPAEAGLEVVANIEQSGAKYLMTTTFPATRSHRRVMHHMWWYPINMELEPFHFPAPLNHTVETHMSSADTYGERWFAIWKLPIQRQHAHAEARVRELDAVLTAQVKRLRGRIDRLERNANANAQGEVGPTDSILRCFSRAVAVREANTRGSRQHMWEEMYALGAGKEFYNMYMHPIPLRWLVHQVDKLGVRSTVDIGAGHYALNEVFNTDRGRYHGIDIAGAAVANLQFRFANIYTSFTWQQLDAATQPLEESFDLAMLRRVLEWLPTREALAILQNVRCSGSTYLVATYYTCGAQRPLAESPILQDPTLRRAVVCPIIANGSQYMALLRNMSLEHAPDNGPLRPFPIDIFAPPFNFPAPLESTIDNWTPHFGQDYTQPDTMYEQQLQVLGYQRHLGLWMVRDATQRIGDTV